MAYRLPLQLRRRAVLKGLLSAGALSVTAQLWAACSSTTLDAPSTDEANVATDPLVTVGFIYEGPKDDYGYNQSHAQAAAVMAAQFPAIKVVEEASVPETTAVQETIRNMIEQDGASVIFPTSHGYLEPHVLQLAAEFPEVQFLHPNLWLDESYSPNVGSYFCYLIEPAYLVGMTAGLATRSNRLGLIIPKKILAVIREVNSFVLGARSVNADVTVQVVVTGDWNSPLKEAEAAHSLIDQGADVILPRVNNAKVIATIAKDRGTFYCGYHVNQADLAAENFLTGIEWNWQTIYLGYAEMVLAGKTLMNRGIPRTLIGGLKEKYSKISPFGVNVSAELQGNIEAVSEKFIHDELVVFAGRIKDNQGNVVIPAGDAYRLGDPRLNTMDWFVEGIKAN
jgi:basic membrane protein A